MSRLAKFKSKFFAYIQLARPVNAMITFLSVLVAAFISGTLEPFGKVILACISAGLIGSAANTINDYYDIEIDRINKPQRTLAAGKLMPRSALIAALLEYTLGILLAIFISFPMFLMALFFSLLTYLYSAYLKRTVLWGNVAVSLTTAAAFVYGGLAVNRPQETIIPAAFAFFFHFGREIIKDMEDIQGDSRYHAKTFPIKFGIPPSIILVWINFIILILLTLLPYRMGLYGSKYLLVVLAGIYPVIFYALISMLLNTTPRHLGFISNLLKADMLVGLLAIYLR
jgi:geranylgeranylglycerol-phosphate geranylgeranyltransferase